MGEPVFSCFRLYRAGAVVALAAITIMTSACATVNVQGYTDDPRRVTVNAATERSLDAASDWAGPAGLRRNPSASRQVVTYNRAMDYLLAARLTLVEKARHREQIDTGTKVGEDIGLTGAMIKSTTKHAQEPVINFLLLGAVSWKINTDVNPLEMSRIYRAGVNNLDCVRSVAALSNQRIKRVRFELGMTGAPGAPTHFYETGVSRNIEAARNAVIQDIYALIAGPYDSGNKAIIDEATGAIASARASRLKMAAGLAEEDTGEKILGAVNATLLAVNREAAETTPTPGRMLNSASALETFLSLGGRFDSQVLAARDAIGKAGATAGDRPSDNAGDSETSAEKAARLQNERTVQNLRNKLAADLLWLQMEVADLPSLSIEADVEAIGACHYIAKPRIPVTVEPGAADLVIGDADKSTADFAAKGTPDFWVKWENDIQPIGIQDSPKPTGVEIHVTDKAAAGTVKIRIGDSLGVLSDPITLNIKAGSSPPAEAPAPTPPNGNSDGSGGSNGADGSGGASGSDGSGGSSESSHPDDENGPAGSPEPKQNGGGQ